ncbi:TRAP transporter substrate-binding protein DctP [Sphingomonas turrisvirgatae]|uniref:ABC transporter substrate-binding protein n=1 Tax=Sphingomonas turrisvirgatae TaxID=1888892 RepID=A0A1E3LVH5_9SPHN|nr:TRAP transporter substrate-binding protein DctP [Sphingomonas turrisvirgatae]ODP37762.1 ABC transporter substrate-binding protein [Sphingomonas turrisvirgatae]
MRILPLILAPMLFLGALAGCSAAPQPRAEHVLTYASPYPPSHPFGLADQEWMKWIATKSGGRIAFKPYWSGALLSSEMSMEEIRHGVADIGLITPIYSKGGAHLLRSQSAFYGGIRDITDQVEVYDCLAARFPQFGKELHGLHVLAVQGGNFPGVLTRDRPIRTLADFKGLRLRAQTDAVDILKQLGADPVNMPMGEVYSALAKGVIDGVVAPADTIRSLHFAEVARHFTTIRVSRGAYPARAMSDRAWRRLPPELQAIMDEGRRVWEAALNRQLLKAEEAGIAYGKSNGISFSPISPAEQQAFDALYNKDALIQARRLANVGIDAVPIYREAQRLIAAGDIRCEAK